MRNSGRAPGRVEQAVTEAVEAVAAPDVRSEVIQLALRWARCSRIPERGPEVDAFVTGPLFFAVERALGEEAAQMVRDELGAVAAQVRGEEALAQPPSPTEWDDDEPELIIEPLVTSPAPRGELPLLVVASSSPVALSLLSLALGGAAYIEPARDPLALLDGLGQGDEGLIVLDCRNPTVRVETLLAMQPDLPTGLRVVLWGESAALEEQLAELGASKPETWICCGANASAEDVATVCRVLLGAG